MPLFNREARVEITTPNGIIQIQNLRIAFSIKKTVNWGSNTCSTSIWNLNPSNRSAIREFGDRMSVYAGYKDNASTGLIFIGRTTQASHKFNQPEIISTLECGDGELNLNSVLISVSYSENISAKTVIRDIARLMDLTIVQFADVNDSDFPKGWSHNGLAKEGLDAVCNYLGLQWSVQNEKLYLLPVNTVSTNAYEININTGMIGVPEQFTYRAQYLPGVARLTGWRVKTLLRPEILPGDEVRIQSSKVNYNLDGSFKVISIIHNGDTYGNPWDSTLELIPVIR